MDFDKAKWNVKNDVFDFTYREKMINDLMQTHLKKGMTYKEVTNLLGESNYGNLPQNTLVYQIKTDYGFGIDPIKVKNLHIEFTNDSILENFELTVWKQ